MLKAENDRLVTDIEKLKQRLREEITRTQAGVRLDLNLEKGRMREQSSGQELKIKEVDTRIEQEIANLRTAIQASKVRLCIVPVRMSYLQVVRRLPLSNILLASVSVYRFEAIVPEANRLFSDGLLSIANGVLALPGLILLSSKL